MDIRKDGWHYRFWKFSYEGGGVPAQTNLCAYFWRTVLGMLMFTLLTAVAVALIGALCFSLYVFPFITIGSIATVVALIAALVYWDEHKRREPGLVGSYVAAKKAKVCPIITFTEVEES